MKDTIYRDDAIKCCRNEWEEEVEERLRLLPSAEPVIRCKDCKHFNDGDCEELPKLVSEDDFCSYAERRTDE